MVPSDKSLVSPVLAGRSSQIQALEEALSAAQQGAGRCYILAGEAGIGKSRLLGELRQRGKDQGFLTLQGDCFESDLTFPFAPVIDGLRRFFASRAPDEIAQILGPLASELVKLVPELNLRLPALEPTPILDPESEKHRLFESLTQFMVSLATPSQPLLLIFEDVHWSDQTSLEFLPYFVRRLEEHPILLLLTYRDDESTPSLTQTLHQIQRLRVGQEIRLAQLSRDDVDVMLRAIFDLRRPVQAEFLEALATLTDGNPLFIEEILKSLVAAGDIFFQDGRWDRKPLDELNIPTTVLSAVQRRSDALDEDTRRVLSLAAVAGRRFDFQLLRALTEHSEALLLDHIRTLIAAQLVVEESADSFAFRHALTRHAVYSGLLARDRRALHESIAKTLEQQHSDSDTQLHLLAYHYYQAGDWEKAWHHAQRAGERALAQHSLSAALEQFNWAIHACQELQRSPLPALYRARGGVHELLGNFEAAASDYTTALDTARKTKDKQAEWESLLALGFLWSGKDIRQSGAFLQESLALARETGDPAMLAHSLNRVGNWHANMEHPLRARQHHEEALGLFRQLDDIAGLGATLDLLGTASYLIGDMPGGIEYYEQALAHLRQAGDQQGLITCLAMYSARGANYLLETVVSPPIPLTECERDAGEAIRLAQLVGWRSGEAYARLMWGFRLANAGEYEQALAMARRGLELALDAGTLNWQVLGNLLHGAIYADLEDLAVARDHLEQALSLADAIGDPGFRREVIGFLAPVYVALGELDLADASLKSALPASDQPLSSESQRLAWFAQTDLALARQRFADVIEVLERGLESAPHVSDGGVIPRLWRLRGDALVGLGRYAEAAQVLQDAQRTAEDQGAKPFLWRNFISLTRLYLAEGRREDAAQASTKAGEIIEDLAARIDDPALRQQFQSRARARIPDSAQLTPRQAEKMRFGGLTRREREVAELIAAGSSNRLIADSLFIGERTVESHVSSILQKLGLENRTQIAAWAVEVGLVK